MRQLKPILIYIIGWPLSITALFFIVKLMLPSLPTLVEQIQHIDLFFLFLGIMCFLGYYFVRAILWHRLLHELSYPLSFLQSTTLWSLSEIKRYIPGNIWAFVGRSVALTGLGVTKKDTGKLLLYEMQIVLLGAIFTSLFGLSYFFDLIGNIPNKLQLMQLIWGVAIVLLGIYVCFPLIKHKAHINKLSFLFPLVPPLSPSPLFTLLSLGISSFIFFGLGYYFTIFSILPTSPKHFIVLTGFFVFSLVIGLFSFITPTGLGVREGAITWGLSKIAPLGISGFASLFGRLTLIVSEVIFLGIALVGKRFEKNLSKYFAFISSHKYEIILYLFICLFIYYFTLVSFMRHDNFYTGRFDLGNMDQTVWNTLHGRIFELTNPNGTENVSRLAFHADFILVLLAPFYLIWEDPKMLLLLQAVVMGGGAYFVWKLALDILKNKPLSLILSVMYLLNPSVGRVTIYDFHPVAFATTFLLASFYYLRKKQYLYFAIWAFLAAITKEQVWLILAFMGVYIVVVQKKRLLGGSVFVVCLTICYLLIGVLIPHALGSEHFAVSYFKEFGDSPVSIIKNIFFSPGQTIQTLLMEDRLSYLFQIFSPYGFLSLLSPLYLLFLLPELTIYLLSDNPNLYQIYYQYTATLTPFLLISTIYGIRNIFKIFPKLPIQVVICYLLLVIGYTSYQFGPLPGSKRANLDMFTSIQPHKEEIETYLQSIPESLSVSATNNLGAHLSHREDLYTVLYGTDSADIIALLPSEKEPIKTSETPLAQELFSSDKFIILYDKYSLLVLKRRIHE